MGAGLGQDWEDGEGWEDGLGAGVASIGKGGLGQCLRSKRGIREREREVSRARAALSERVVKGVTKAREDSRRRGKVGSKMAVKGCGSTGR